MEIGLAIARLESLHGISVKVSGGLNPVVTQQVFNPRLRIAQQRRTGRRHETKFLTPCDLSRQMALGDAAQWILLHRVVHQVIRRCSCGPVDYLWVQKRVARLDRVGIRDSVAVVRQQMIGKAQFEV